MAAEKVIFGPVQKYANEVSRSVTGESFPRFFMDWTRRADVLLQFGVPEFEYPRSDLPGNVHFIGPVSQGGGKDNTDLALPGWWDELDSGRPIVHVTQGTVANRNYNDLIRPTIDSLANDDVLVVVSTGGRPEDTLPGPWPANVRVSSYLPYDELLPKTSVLVANGGFGGVQFALRHGVPLVVAGQSEEKVEVCARVAWSGTGINLRTNRAKPDDVAKAVRKVLSGPSYRQYAQRIAAAIRASPGVEHWWTWSRGILAIHLMSGIFTSNSLGERLPEIIHVSYFDLRTVVGHSGTVLELWRCNEPLHTHP